jgi:hypothetical protein
MSKLYSYNREMPYEMHQLNFPDGSTRTGDDYTEKELKAANVTGPYTIPEYDQNYQRLGWDSSNLEFVPSYHPDEIYINRVREYRNFELRETDRYMLLDTIGELNQKTLEELKLYRRWLRELPQKMISKEINIPKTHEEFESLFSTKLTFLTSVDPATGIPSY